MKLSVRILLLILIVSLALLAAGCSAYGSGTEEGYIVKADEVAALLEQENTVLVDMQNENEYLNSHVKGAVNIPRANIVINEPFANMLLPKSQLEKVMGSKGIGNDTLVIAYDNTKNMDAARLWWTLMVYGHVNVKVVSGGLEALKAAGAEMSTEAATLPPATFTAKDKNTAMIATRDEVMMLVNVPKEDHILLDVRTEEEYREGTIPGSVLFDYVKNNNMDGTYKSGDAIVMQYDSLKITPEKTTIMYCKTSIRAAQTYLALYNVGYRNLKLYDGAWLEWSSNSSNPVQVFSGNEVLPSQSDNS